MQLFQWKKYLKHVINQKSICKIYYIATACNTQPCPAFPQQADGLTQNIGQQLLCFRPKQTHRHSTDKHSKTLNSKLTSVKQSVISDTPCRAQTPSSYTKHREQKPPGAPGPGACSRLPTWRWPRRAAPWTGSAGWRRSARTWPPGTAPVGEAARETPAGRAGPRRLPPGPVEEEEKGEEEGGGPGRARTCSRALEDARRVVWPSTSMGSRRQQMAPSRRDGVSAAETASAPGRNAGTEPAGSGLCSSGFGMNVSSSVTLRIQVVNFQSTRVGSGAKTNVQRQLSASQAGIPLEPPPKTAPWLMRKYIVLHSIFWQALFSRDLWKISMRVSPVLF